MYRKIFIALSLSLTALTACAQSDFPDERESMVERVMQLAELTGGETGRPQFSERVIDALRLVPRHEFVPEALRGAAAREYRIIPRVRTVTRCSSMEEARELAETIGLYSGTPREVPPSRCRSPAGDTG